MKKFLYITHIDYITQIRIGSIMLCFLIIATWNQWRYDLGGIIFIVFGTEFLVRYIKTMGVYIDNKSVLFKTCFSRKATCVEEIVAIKIERAIQESINWPSFYLKDNRGNQLFEMIAVSKYDADMLQPARGHTDFIY